MTAADAFAKFTERCIKPAKRDRYVRFALTQRGQRKILDALCHDFELDIDPKSIRTRDYSELWNLECFVFHPTVGFGAEYATVREAYDAMQSDDGWLIVVADGSIGIYRPESRWDDEKLIGG